MKNISINERPIGRFSNHTCFYSEDVIQETELAMLVKVYISDFSEFENRWLPKSKMLAYNHIDNRDLIDNGRDFVKNPNYGKDRIQYFIPSFFIKESAKSQALMQFSKEGSLAEQRMERSNQLVIK
jgi:hypothetical protein